MSKQQAEQRVTTAVVAHREPAVRDAIGTLVAEGLGMQLVGEAETVPALQRSMREECPDLLVVAWNLLVAEAASLLAGLHAQGARVVVLGLRPETAAAARAAGADGYISMVDTPDVVARVLQRSMSSGAQGDA